MLYDLTGKKVSFTYGRLVQIASGSYYDGFGNLLDLPGPSGSYFTTGSNYPITSSWSINSISASYAPCSCPIMITGSNYPITSSWSINTISSSYTITSSYSLSSSHSITSSYSLSASYAPCNCPIMHTGSTYPITSSWAINTLTSSYIEMSQVSCAIKTITNDYNIVSGDYTILCDASAGNINLKLKAASSTNKRLFNIKKIDATGYLVNVTTTNADLIDFETTQSIAFRGTNMCVQSNGVQYWIL